MSEKPLLPSDTLVIDNGSGFCKSGTSGCVMSTIPTIVGRSKHSMYLGSDLNDKTLNLVLSSPIEKGVVVDWEDMIKVWGHVIGPEFFKPKRVLFTEVLNNSDSNRKKMAEIMFETLDIPSLCVTTPAILSLIDSDLTSGVVVDSGDGITHVVSIVESKIIAESIERLNVSGSDITHSVSSLLHEFGLDSKTVIDIKEKYCYVKSKEEEVNPGSSSEQIRYIFSNGKTVFIDDKVLTIPELLFRSSFVPSVQPSNENRNGIHLSTYASIMSCVESKRNDLFANIVLSGGNTMITNFDQRFKEEITLLAPDITVNVIAPAERQYSAYRGGHKLAKTLPEDLWMKKNAYQESGASVVHSYGYPQKK